MKKDIKRIAVFTSGGDAPGMNAAIRAVVRTASYNDMHVFGITRGYDGMINGQIKRLESSDVANIIHRGGTILKSARCDAFRTPEGRKQAYENLVAHDIDACVAIGGNGTFTGALLMSQEYNIPFVGLPGTIDNDLYGTDFTIGFDTAVNTAMDAVDKIRDTADSHNRLFFVEVMGRDSGYIALNTGIGSGSSGVLIPENNTTIDELVEMLRKGAKRNKLFSIIIVAEGSKIGGAQKIAEIVKEKFDFYDTKIAIIGHLQRGGSPSCADRVLASRLGYAAVKALQTGHHNVAIGLVNNKIKYTPFDEAIHHTKALDSDLMALSEILALS
jgi:6-phosphofructokinase 1